MKELIISVLKHQPALISSLTFTKARNLEGNYAEVLIYLHCWKMSLICILIAHYNYSRRMKSTLKLIRCTPECGWFSHIIGLQLKNYLLITMIKEIHTIKTKFGS